MKREKPRRVIVITGKSVKNSKSPKKPPSFLIKKLIVVIKYPLDLRPKNKRKNMFTKNLSAFRLAAKGEAKIAARAARVRAIALVTASKKIKALLAGLFLASTLSAAPLNVVTTINYFDDLIEQVAGSLVKHQGLMGEGVDPHMYQATANDLKTIEEADLVVYGGLHLEGKMDDIFSDLGKKGKVQTLNLSEALDKKTLFEEGGEYDPHVWFDTNNFALQADFLAKKLGEMDKENAAKYKANAERFKGELKELESYIKARFKDIPANSRYLVTVHDAFSYFARQFGLEVKPVMGVTTDAQTSLKEIKELTDFIVAHKVKAIFTESSTPAKSILKLQEGAKAQGFEVKVGKELYSDSMGSKEDGHETYVKTLKYNADTIADALK